MVNWVLSQPYNALMSLVGPSNCQGDQQTVHAGHTALRRHTLKLHLAGISTITFGSLSHLRAQTRLIHTKISLGLL